MCKGKDFITLRVKENPKNAKKNSFRIHAPNKEAPNTRRRHENEDKIKVGTQA